MTWQPNPVGRTPLVAAYPLRYAMQALGAVWDDRANRWQVPDARVAEARQIIAWHKEYAAAHPNDPEAHEAPRLRNPSFSTGAAVGVVAVLAAAAAIYWYKTRSGTPSPPDASAWKANTDLLVMYDDSTLKDEAIVKQVKALADGIRALNVDDVVLTGLERMKHKVLFVFEIPTIGAMNDLIKAGATVLVVTKDASSLDLLTTGLGKKTPLIVLPTTPVSRPAFEGARQNGANVVGVSPTEATLGDGWANDIFNMITDRRGIPDHRRL